MEFIPSCESMGFDLVSFIPVIYGVELGLIRCLIRYPHSRLQSCKKIVWLPLLFGFTHFSPSLPCIPVLFTNPFGTFKYWCTNTLRGQNCCWFHRKPSIQTGRVYCIILRAEVILRDPTGVANCELTLPQGRTLLLTFTLK